MGRCRIGCDRQSASDVVGQDGRAAEWCVCLGAAGIAVRNRLDRDGHGAGGRLTGCIGSRVGEGVRAAEARCWCVEIGAVSVHRHRTVGGRRRAGDRKSDTEVITHHRGSVQRRIGRRRTHITNRDRCHGDGHGCRGRLSGRVGGGVGEGVRTGVTGDGCVGVGAVGRDRQAAVAGGRVTRNSETCTEVVAKNGADDRRLGWCRGDISKRCRRHMQRDNR